MRSNCQFCYHPCKEFFTGSECHKHGPVTVMFYNYIGESAGPCSPTLQHVIKFVWKENGTLFDVRFYPISCWLTISYGGKTLDIKNYNSAVLYPENIQKKIKLLLTFS